MLTFDVAHSVALALALSSAGAGAEEEAVYRLRIEGSAPRILHVEAELPCQSGALRLGEYRPHPEKQPWGDYVEELEVQTLEGASIAWQPAAPNRWELEVPHPERIRIRYRLRLDHDQVQWPPSTAESSFHRPDCVFFRNYGVLIASPEVPSALISLDLPDDWAVTTPLDPVDGDPRRRRSDSRYQTYNSGMMLGTHATARVNVGDIVLDLGASADLPGAIDAMVPVFEAALDEASAVFGGALKSRYAIMAALNPKAPSHAGSSLGNGMSVLQGANPPKDQGGLWAYVLTHELMHMWAGGVIANQSSRDEQWFDEGLADYLTMVIAGRRDLLRESVRLNYMGRNWHGYLALAGDRSLTEAGTEKSRFYNFIYGGGMYIMQLTDIEIRRASEGQRGIDDLMRALNAEFGAARLDMTSEDFARVASEVAGADLTWIVERFVRGDEVLTTEMVLAPLGLTDGMEGSTSPRPPLARDPNASDDALALRRAILSLE